MPTRDIETAVNIYTEGQLPSKKINPWTIGVFLSITFIFLVRSLVWGGQIAGSLINPDEECDVDNPTWWLINLFSILTCLNIPFQIYNHFHDREIEYPDEMIPHIIKYQQLLSQNRLQQRRLIPLWKNLLPFTEWWQHMDWATKVRVIEWAYVWCKYLSIFPQKQAITLYANLFKLNPSYVDCCFMLIMPAAGLIDSRIIRSVRAQEKQVGLVRWYHSYCSYEYGPTCLFATPRKLKKVNTKEKKAFMSYLETADNTNENHFSQPGEYGSVGQLARLSP